jgi:hypothetical protein
MSTSQTCSKLHELGYILQCLLFDHWKGSLILGDQWLGRKRDVILLVVILDGFSKFVFFCAVKAVMSKVVSDAIEQIMESPSPPSGSAEVFRLSTKMSTHPGNTSVLTCLTPSEVLRQLVLSCYCVFCYLSWEMFSFSVLEEGRCLYSYTERVIESQMELLHLFFVVEIIFFLNMSVIFLFSQEYVCYSLF